MFGAVGPSSGRISKTKQDGPKVTMEHYYEVDTDDSVAAFRSSPQTHLHGDILVSYTASCSTWRQTTAVVNRA